MQIAKKNRNSIQQPDFSVSKVNQERATKLFDNFMNATKRTIEKNISSLAIEAVMLH